MFLIMGAETALKPAAMARFRPKFDFLGGTPILLFPAAYPRLDFLAFVSSMDFIAFVSSLDFIAFVSSLDFIASRSIELSSRFLLKKLICRPPSVIALAQTPVREVFWPFACLGTWQFLALRPERLLPLGTF
jgi:hypothetical protein